MLGDAPKHIWTNLDIIVKCPSVGSCFIWMDELYVRRPFAAIRFWSPPKAEQCAVNPSRFRAGPVAQHDRARETLNSRLGDVLVRSIRSARTRNARACTERMA